MIPAPPPKCAEKDTALAAEREAREKAERELALLRPVVDAARKGLKAVRMLIEESRGVDGLHLNGDVAPWDELLAGGQFEHWLFDFSAAQGALLDYDAAKEQP